MTNGCKPRITKLKVNKHSLYKGPTAHRENKPPKQNNMEQTDKQVKPDMTNEK